MPKIAIIGAGSMVFCKNLISDILSFPALKDSTFALMDIDAERLRVIHVSPHEGKLFSQEIQEFCEALKASSSAAVA